MYKSLPSGNLLLDLWLSFGSLPLWPLGENSKFPFFGRPKLCKVWISIASLGSVNIHKIQSEIPFFHRHCIPSQNSRFELHDSCFKKLKAKALFVFKKVFKSRAVQNIGPPNHVFTVGNSSDNNPIHATHSKSVQYFF